MSNDNYRYNLLPRIAIMFLNKERFNSYFHITGGGRYAKN